MRSKWSDKTHRPAAIKMRSLSRFSTLTDKGPIWVRRSAKMWPLSDPDCHTIGDEMQENVHEHVASMSWANMTLETSRSLDEQRDPFFHMMQHLEVLAFRNLHMTMWTRWVQPGSLFGSISSRPSPQAPHCQLSNRRTSGPADLRHLQTACVAFSLETCGDRQI